jgi:hypothetical protein
MADIQVLFFKLSNKDLSKSKIMSSLTLRNLSLKRHQLVSDTLKMLDLDSRPQKKLLKDTILIRNVLSLERLTLEEESLKL